MDVTPSDKMYAAMEHFTTAVCGEAPLRIEKSAAAEKVRSNRKNIMDFLHRLVHLSMREGAARAMATSTPSGLEIVKNTVDRHYGI